MLDKCQLCPSTAVDSHHVFFQRRRGKNSTKKIRDYVDAEYNQELFCRPCHITNDNYENREYYFEVQLARYGDALIQWFNRCPEKLKTDPRWTELNEMIKRSEK